MNLLVGDYIRHLKRGSVYQIIGIAVENGLLKDNTNAMLVLGMIGYCYVADTPVCPRGATLCIPLSFQRSIDLSEAKAGASFVFVYREVTEGAIYARPIYEFTPDRFAKAAK